MNINLVSEFGPESNKYLFHRLGLKPFNTREDYSYCYQLLSIPGQVYILGSNYGVTEGEFLYYDYLPVGKKQNFNIASITVDKEGGFWVKSIEPSRWKLYLNKKKVTGKVLVKPGDNIRFEPVLEGFLPLRFQRFSHVFNVQLGDDGEFLRKMGAGESLNSQEGESSERIIPWENTLVLSKIFLHLKRFRDLKSCRLVSKLWEEEARKLVEERGKIYFHFWPFNTYFHPKNSLKIFSFLNQVSFQRVKTLSLELPLTNESIPHKIHPAGGGCAWVDADIPVGQSANKMFDDIKKLVISNIICDNVTCLFLEFHIKSSLDLEIFSTLMSLRLRELRFLGLIEFDGKEFKEGVIEPSPDFFSGKEKTLRTFTHIVPRETGNWKRIDVDNTNISTAGWEKVFPPLLNKVEVISVENENVFKLYFGIDFVMIQLREIYLEKVSFSSLKLLLKLERTLTVLEILKPPKSLRNEDAAIFQEIVHFHSQTLQILKIELPMNLEWTFSFPRLPSLKEFLIKYNKNVGIEWEGLEVVDYEQFFPKLRSLKVYPASYEEREGRTCTGWYTYQFRLPFNWRNENDAWHSFFPRVGLVCETVRELADLEDYKNKELSVEDDQPFKTELKRVARMFPNAKGDWDVLRQGCFTGTFVIQNCDRW